MSTGAMVRWAQVLRSTSASTSPRNAARPRCARRYRKPIPLKAALQSMEHRIPVCPAARPAGVDGKDTSARMGEEVTPVPDPLPSPGELERWTERTAEWLRRYVDDAGAQGVVFGL